MAITKQSIFHPTSSECVHSYIYDRQYGQVCKYCGLVESQIHYAESSLIKNVHDRQETTEKKIPSLPQNNLSRILRYYTTQTSWIIRLKANVYHFLQILNLPLSRDRVIYRGIKFHKTFMLNQSQSKKRYFMEEVAISAIIYQSHHQNLYIDIHDICRNYEVSEQRVWKYYQKFVELFGRTDPKLRLESYLNFALNATKMPRFIYHDTKYLLQKFDRILVCSTKMKVATCLILSYYSNPNIPKIKYFAYFKEILQIEFCHGTHYVEIISKYLGLNIAVKKNLRKLRDYRTKLFGEVKK